MLNNHEANLTDEEAAAEVARVAKIYPVVRLLSADQVKSDRNCLLAGDRCPCLRQSSLEAMASSDEISERLLSDGVEYRARVRSLTVEGEPHVLLMVRPIDEQEAAEEDLVYTDVLTGVHNRRYYEEKLRSARMNAGVAMIDLDDFRVFNDTCGRHAGDLALGAVAAAIRSGIRSTDELVRLGCDKFVAVMPDIPSDDFARRLRHVSDAVHATIVPGHEHVSLTACVGGVHINGETVDEGVSRAVQLLSHAKAKPGTVVTDADAIETFQSDKPSILIVDDSEMNRVILNEMLKDEYRILEADNGRAALDMVDRYGDELSLVLLDIIMPGMNGFEVLGCLVHRSDKFPLDNEQRSTIAMASALHDIGKMSIDDAILNKPGRLTSEEFEIMKTHTTLGADMLLELGRQHAGNSLLEYAYQIARWHHERWDGKGYPDGLKGDDIPIAAQVVSVADVYDALTSVRVYKDAIPHQEAIQMILDGKCGAFNPLLLDCLLEVQDRIAETLARPADVVAFPTI